MSDSSTHSASPRAARLGLAVVGVGGAVATTAAAGLELMRLGISGHEGLPLAELGAEHELRAYEEIVIGGWDVCGDDLAVAVDAHGVLGSAELAAAAPGLAALKPWPAIDDQDFHPGVGGTHRRHVGSKRAAVEAIRADLRAFREQAGLDALVMVNLASTERVIDVDSPVLASAASFERGIGSENPEIGPALLYAYAALMEGVPYANFTPSVAAEVPALVEVARREGVPTAGKDGKTGQTMLKTVIAPALRARALRVEGWYSANILGNRDGQALHDPASLASKLATKGSVLDSILGYEVADHLVRIDYYAPRGDAKEAWDSIDLVGFLGQRMQLKVNFLCRDSVLAAPLVLELARLLDFAQRRGESGPLPALGLFFKAPMTGNGPPEHALHRQVEQLASWLGTASGAADAIPAGSAADPIPAGSAADAIPAGGPADAIPAGERRWASRAA